MSPDSKKIFIKELILFLLKHIKLSDSDKNKIEGFAMGLLTKHSNDDK